jgi:hypothetical protein
MNRNSEKANAVTTIETAITIMKMNTVIYPTLIEHLPTLLQKDDTIGLR